MLKWNGCESRKKYEMFIWSNPKWTCFNYLVKLIRGGGIMSAGIYYIRNIVNNKKYIGSSADELEKLGAIYFV